MPPTSWERKGRAASGRPVQRRHFLGGKSLKAHRSALTSVDSIRPAPPGGSLLEAKEGLGITQFSWMPVQKCSFLLKPTYQGAERHTRGQSEFLGRIRSGPFHRGIRAVLRAAAHRSRKNPWKKGQVNPPPLDPAPRPEKLGGRGHGRKGPLSPLWPLSLPRACLFSAPAPCAKKVT
jgi:hypothetical protein